MQSRQRFQGTPYLLDEIMAARAELKRRLDPYSSQALQTLQRKCSFAVHGPQHSYQRSSLTNDCFTTIQLQSSYPGIPDSQLSLTRDSRQSEAVIDLTQQSDDSSSLSSSQSGTSPRNRGSKKRKREDDHETNNRNSIKDQPASLKPPKKRFHQASTSQDEEVVESGSNLLTRWKCDVCRIMTMKKPLMNRHLATKGHYSASLVRCERVSQGLKPVLVMAPAAMTHSPSLGKNFIPLCPAVSCNRVFATIYACSEHYSRTHIRPTGSTRAVSTLYSIGRVLQENKILINSDTTCACGRKFKAHMKFRNHVLSCKTSFQRRPPESFMVFACFQCNKLFHEFHSANQHIVKCCQQQGSETECFMRILHVEKNIREPKTSMFHPELSTLKFFHDRTKKSDLFNSDSSVKSDTI